MSSRQTMSRYMGSGDSGYNIHARPDNAGILSRLLGKDKLSGGLTTGVNGELGFQPYSGSSGFFGGWSRNKAMDLNAMMGSPLLLQQMQGKQASQLSAQEAGQKQAQATLENNLHIAIMKSAQMNALASSLGIPVEELAGSLSKELAQGALLKQQNVNAALKNPDVAKSEQDKIIGENMSADAANRMRLKQEAGPMGVSSMPGSRGGAPTTLFGGMPQQSTTLERTGPIDPKTKLPMSVTPIINQSPVPGRISVPSNIFDAAKQVQPQGNGQTPLDIPSPQSPGASINNGMPGNGTGNTLADYINGQNAIATGTTPPNPAVLTSGMSPTGMTNPPSTPPQVSQRNTSDYSDPLNWPSGMWQFITGLMNQAPVNSLQYGQ